MEIYKVSMLLQEPTEIDKLSDMKIYLEITIQGEQVSDKITCKKSDSIFLSVLGYMPSPIFICNSLEMKFLCSSCFTNSIPTQRLQASAFMLLSHTNFATSYKLP